MPQGRFGATFFDVPDDHTGRLKITNAEGSAIAVPFEDVLTMVAAWVHKQRPDPTSWQEVLLGKR